MIEVGNFCILGDWDETPDPDGKVCIRLVPSNVFGIGNHVSTQAFLRALEKTPPQGAVFDAGCGSGILSIAVLKLGATSVDCVDISPEAIRVASLNMAASGISQGFNVIRGDVGEITGLKSLYDLIVMNTGDSVDAILTVAGRIRFKSMLVMPETKDVSFLKATLEATNFGVTVVEEARRWTLMRIDRST